MSAEERKRKQRCEFQCKKHLFALQTLKGQPSKFDIQVQFCPKYQREPLPPEQTFPSFNHDSKFYTSAFVLGIDKRSLAKYDQQEYLDHHKQVRASLERHNQLAFPFRNSRHSVCSVCKDQYLNYYLHILSEEHCQRIRLSQYNRHISDLCFLYKDYWEGAEEKADQQAEENAKIQEQKRLKIQLQDLPEASQQSEQVLESQKSEENAQIPQKQQNSKENPLDKHQSSRLIIKDDSQNHKDRKRRRRQPIEYIPQVLPTRNRDHSNPYHATRARKQRQYQREREQLMKGTEFQQFKRYFKPRAGKEDDPFIILQRIQRKQEEKRLSTKNNQLQLILQQLKQEISKKDMPESQIEKSYNQHSNEKPRQLQERRSEEENKIKQIPKKVKNKQKKQITIIQLQSGEAPKSDSSHKASKAEEKQSKTPKNNPITHKKANQPCKFDPRLHLHPYPPPIHHFPYKHHHPQVYRSAQIYKGGPQTYKGVSPYYFNPYAFPMFDPQYMRPNEKGYELLTEAQEKVNEKHFQYPIPYHWPYPPPFAMPPIRPIHSSKHLQHTAYKSTLPQGNTQHLTSEKPQDNQSPYKPSSIQSTSININFPMYMYPPHPSIYPMPPSRYSLYPMMNPSIDYQFGSKIGQQRKVRQTQYCQSQGNPRSSLNNASIEGKSQLAHHCQSFPANLGSNAPNLNQRGKLSTEERVNQPISQENHLIHSDMPLPEAQIPQQQQRMSSPKKQI